MSAADPARRRFAVLSALRFGGMGLGFAGAMVFARPGQLAHGLGLALLGLGLGLAMVVPQRLARRWRSNGQ